MPLAQSVGMYFVKTFFYALKKVVTDVSRKHDFYETKGNIEEKEGKKIVNDFFAKSEKTKESFESKFKKIGRSCEK